MLQHIFVPLDGSSYAASAIPVAARLARATGGSVTLLQSVPYPLETGEFFTEPQVSVKGPPEADRARVVDYLTRIAASDELAGVPTTIDVTDRPPVQAILSDARLYQADIIVMRSGGAKGMGRWISGSIAREVGRHSPVPVLVLRTGDGMINLSPGGIRPVVVLVALDGSSLAEAALTPAAQLSAVLSAPAPGVLHLVQVLHFPTMEAGGRHEQGVAARKWAEAEAQVYLRSIEQRLREGDFASLHLSITSSVVASTDVVHTLTGIAESSICREGVEELNRCHIIAMATHGRSGLQHLLAGSVTEGVSDATRYPLLIVRSPQLQETREKTSGTVREMRPSDVKSAEIGLHF
jgi:nucleotide-binding universal stress UspA family protein